MWFWGSFFFLRIFWGEKWTWDVWTLSQVGQETKEGGGGEKKRRRRRRWRQRLLLLSPSFSPWLFALADRLQSFNPPPLPHSSCHLLLLCYSFFTHLVILLLHSLSCVAFKRWWMWPSYKHVDVNIMFGFFFFTAYFRPIRALLPGETGHKLYFYLWLFWVYPAWIFTYGIWLSVLESENQF